MRLFHEFIKRSKNIKCGKNEKGIVSLKIIHKNNELLESKYVLQSIYFRCVMAHNKSTLKNISLSYGLQRELLKEEMDEDEVFEDIWMDKKYEWIDFLKNDVLCTTLSCPRYGKGMEEITGFRMKNKLTLPLLVWKHFNTLRDESDEPIFTHGDKYMRWIERQNIKKGRCASFHRYYSS